MSDDPQELAVYCLRSIAQISIPELNPDGVDQAAESMRLIAVSGLEALGIEVPVQRVSVAQTDPDFYRFQCKEQAMSSNETTTEYRVARTHPDGLIPVTDWGGRDDAVDGAAHAERRGGGRVIVQQRTVTYGPIGKAPMTKLLAEYGS